MSTFYESRDQGPAEPIGLLKQLNGDISSIKNLVLSKCSFALRYFLKLFFLKADFKINSYW